MGRGRRRGKREMWMEKERKSQRASWGQNHREDRISRDHPRFLCRSSEGQTKGIRREGGGRRRRITRRIEFSHSNGGSLDRKRFSTQGDKGLDV